MIRKIETRMGVKEIEMVNWNNNEIPKTLYKYRDWCDQYHKKILTNQELFFSSPSKFNDPFDCNIPIAYHLLKDNPDLAKDFFNDVVKRHNPNLSVEKHKEEVARHLKDGRFKDLEYLKKMNKKSLEDLHNIYGVLSLTAVNNNILMWAHYANAHKGFCVGFDSAKLFNECGGGGNVNYAKEFPKILPTEELMKQVAKQILTKASFWDYEIEYRLFKMDFANKVIQIPSEFITELILGYSMPNSHEKEILDLVSDKLPHVKVFKIVPSYLQFEFDLEKMN